MVRQKVRAMNSPPFDPLLNIRDVQRLTTLSRASIYRYMKAGHFPMAVALGRTARGATRCAWKASQVQAWNESPLEWGRNPWDDDSGA